MRLVFLFNRNVESVYNEGPEWVEKVFITIIGHSWFSQYRYLDNQINTLEGIGRDFLEQYGFKDPTLKGDESELEFSCEAEREWLLTHSNPEIRKLAIDL